MSLDLMRQAIKNDSPSDSRVKIEASGNITLETIRAVAETGVDYTAVRRLLNHAGFEHEDRHQ